MTWQCCMFEICDHQFEVSLDKVVVGDAQLFGYRRYNMRERQDTTGFKSMIINLGHGTYTGY